MKFGELLEFRKDLYFEGAVQIVWLGAGNVLTHTGIYIKGITPSEFEKQYKKIMRTHYDANSGDSYKNGDIDNRSQAK